MLSEEGGKVTGLLGGWDHANVTIAGVKYDYQNKRTVCRTSKFCAHITLTFLRGTWAFISTAML